MDVIVEMGRFTPVRTAFGIKDSVARNEKITAHVVVGTPGTVLDLITRKSIDTKDIRVFVLDEADNMLDQQNLGAQCMRIKRFVYYILNKGICINLELVDCQKRLKLSFSVLLSLMM